MFTIKAWKWTSDVLGNKGQSVCEREVCEAYDYRVFYDSTQDPSISVRANTPEGARNFQIAGSEFSYHQVIVENSKGQTTDRFRWVMPAEGGKLPYATGF